MLSCCEFHKNNHYVKAQNLNGLCIYHSPERIEYTNKLLNLLEAKIVSGPQTYGFEYEFISREPLNLEIMDRIYTFLPETGFRRHNTSFVHDSGMYIDFEPGGQIEFHSPPLIKGEAENLNNYLSIINDVLAAINLKLGIEYAALGYVPGRMGSPLCLDSERYINLHNRLAMRGTRGLEMMKGTASIHFHAGIKNIEELPGLFAALIRISEMDDFKMGDDRREIWDNTDPERCGQPFYIDESDTPFDVIEKIVDDTIHAGHIGENKPFIETDDLSFDAFMYHLTTIFTDIRLNVKGPSIELRTIDSVSFDQFKLKWHKFISILEFKRQSDTGI
jgi:gamma-glutamylcysteine synthetase